MRLHELIRRNRDRLVQSWLDRTRGTLTPSALPSAETVDSLPEFLEQLAHCLEGGGGAADERLQRIAAAHGLQRLSLGFDLGEVVREFGILRGCILEVARELGHPASAEDLDGLLRHIDAARSASIANYTAAREQELQDHAAMHVAFMAHELRNPLSSARMAVQFLQRKGALEPSERHAEVLDRSLRRLQDIIDTSLLDVRLKAKLQPQRARLLLRALLEELKTETSSEAESRQVTVELEVEGELRVDADPRLLRSALSNLLRNALKFTHRGGCVRVHAHGAGPGRVSIDVSDECGGLPEGVAERMFDPFIQLGADRSGFGLGLAITKQAVDAHAGTLRVHDLPGKGCIFTVELPVLALPDAP